MSVRTIQLWVEAGTLRAWKTRGGHRRIARESVHAILTQRQAEQGGPGMGGQAEDAACPVVPRLKVLVIEENEDSQAVYRLAVDSLPFPIDLRCEATGLRGLVTAGQFEPDVLIFDLNISGLDGFAVLEALAGSSATAACRIYVLSQLSASQIHARGGLPAKATALTTPLPVSLLLHLLSEAFRENYLKG